MTLLGRADTNKSTIKTASGITTITILPNNSNNIDNKYEDSSYASVIRKTEIRIQLIMIVFVGRSENEEIIRGKRNDDFNIQGFSIFIF